MRRRFQVPLYTDNPGHIDVIEHLVQFPSSDRGKELALLVQVGYKVLYGNNADNASALASIAMSENQRLQELLVQQVSGSLRSQPPGAGVEQALHKNPQASPPPEVPSNSVQNDHLESSGSSGNQASEGSGSKSKEDSSQEDPRRSFSSNSDQNYNNENNDKRHVSDPPSPDDSELADYDPAIEEDIEDMDEDVADPMSIITGG